MTVLLLRELSWPRVNVLYIGFYPPPRGGIAIFDSMSDFVKVHIEPHPANQTIITYQDGHKDVYGHKPDEDKEEEEK